MQSSRDHSHFDNKITRTLPKLSNIKRTCRWYIWQTSHLSFACKIPIRSPPLKTSKHGASMWSEGSWWNQHEPTWIMKCCCASGDLPTSMHSISKRSSTPPCSKHLLDSLILLVLRFRLPSETLGLGLGSDRTRRWDRSGVGSQPPFAVSPSLSP